MAGKKTMEDWFLRGGEKPDEEDGDPAVAGEVCQNCGHPVRGESECPHCGAAPTGGCPTDEYCGAEDDDWVLQDCIVTMSRTKTVQQTAKVRVKAHSEDEALDLIEDRAEDEAGNWPWKDEDGTEEYEDIEAIEAEVVR